MAQLHVTIMPNKKGRDFVVGDIHGQTPDLFQAMKDVAFDTKVDRLFSVGDVIDRGPDSLGAIKLLDEPWFYTVRGNHEQIAIEAIKSQNHKTWLLNGGKWADNLPYGILLDMKAKFLKLPYALSLLQADGSIVGICHAEWLESDWAEVGQIVMNYKKVGEMLWGRQIFREKIIKHDKTAAVTIHGHTAVRKPTKLGTALFIETAAKYNRTLSLMTIEEAIAIPSIDRDIEEDVE